MGGGQAFTDGHKRGGGGKYRGGSEGFGDPREGGKQVKEGRAQTGIGLRAAGIVVCEVRDETGGWVCDGGAAMTPDQDADVVERVGGKGEGVREAPKIAHAVGKGEWWEGTG